MNAPRHALPQHAWHPRSYRENRYVYPVLSRRAKGISVGVNLNPNKICNFDCLYCQVDRRSDAEVDFVDTDRLIEELDRTIDWVLTGELFNDEKFAPVPADLRRLNDIAFSGDGEPTSFRNFASVVSQVVELQRRKHLLAVKLIVLTNASLLDRPAVCQAMDTLMSHHGEIWAKLDAGTQEYFRRVSRTPIPFSRILGNLQQASRRWPLVIQTMFMQIDGQPPSVTEIDAYLKRITDIIDGGGTVKLVQLYTVARPPAEQAVTPLSAEQLEDLAQRLRRCLPVPVETHPGRQ